MILELMQGKKGDRSGLMGVVEEALINNDWKFRKDTDAPVIRFGAKGKNADFNGILVVKEERDLLLFYVIFSMRVPEGKLKEAAEFITRANYGLNIGNFELDIRNGEIRYKVSVDVEGGVLSHAMVRNMLSAGFSTADRYYPAFMSVIYGNNIPSVAIREVEG